MLPEAPIEWRTVTVAGQEIKIRSVTYPQAVEIGQLLEAGEIVEANLIGIAYGTDTPIDEVRAWAERTTPGTVEALGRAVADAGVLTEGATKST